MEEAEAPRRYGDTLIFPAALDPDALRVIHRLRRSGHEAYLVGGCVRDLLLGRLPKDFDVATSARPRQVRRIFKNSKVIGRRFKLVHVIFRDKFIEVSTFRRLPKDENDFFRSDGLLILRDNVYGTERDDALRRDFTINALFYDVEQEEVIDYCGGVHDIGRRLLRTIGDPMIRFREDPVRILRALRFSCRLQLTIVPAVWEAMKACVQEIRKCAAQRVTEEIVRLIACGSAHRALPMMMELGLFEILLPELHAVLHEEVRYFGYQGTGRSFLLRLARCMDETDQGRRRFENPMYLALLFAHLGGLTLEADKEGSREYRDPGMLLDGCLRPIALRMGVSKRDLGRIKQILIAYRRMEPAKKRKRYKVRDFCRRDYFPDALEFYRQVQIAKEGNLDRYQAWLEKLQEFGIHRTDHRSGEGSPRRSRGGRSRRRRGRSRRRRA